MIANYATKKELKASIGKPLHYAETSMFGNEYPEGGTGKFAVCNRPHLTGYKREFFAEVTLKDHKIVKVS